jgi:hypothetical protein
MPKSRKSLIARRVDDDNFAHAVSLMGAMAAWAEEVNEDDHLCFNSINMIHLPVEIALAFMTEYASAETQLGDAVRTAMATLKEFRANDADPGA